MYTARVHGRVQAVYTAVYTDHVQVYTARTRTVHGRIRGRVDGRVRAGRRPCTGRVDDGVSDHVHGRVVYKPCTQTALCT